MLVEFPETSIHGGRMGIYMFLRIGAGLQGGVVVDALSRARPAGVHKGRRPCRHISRARAPSEGGDQILRDGTPRTLTR